MDAADITFDDIASFVRKPPPTPTPPPPQSGGGGREPERDYAANAFSRSAPLGRSGEDDYPTDTFRRPAERGGGSGGGGDFQQRVSADRPGGFKRSLTSILDDDYDTRQHPLGVRPLSRQQQHIPDLSQLLDGYKGPPIVTSGKKLSTTIPYDVYAAAETLLLANKDGDVRMDRGFVQELDDLVTRYQHEYICIDPPVLICDHFPLSTSHKNAPTVYMEEAVPISLLLLALFLRCSYGIPGLLAAGQRGFDQIKVAPFEGRLIPGCQSFHLKEQVLVELEERGFNVPDAMRNMQLLMMRVGEISSKDACNGVWIDDTVQQLGNVLRGQHQRADEKSRK